MNYVTNGFEPSCVLRFFEAISAIPRGSFHEERIADYLVNFAEDRGLVFVRDADNNVLIRKGATEGQEHRAPVLLQGHTDMVCEKNSDVVHDFLKDPLKLQIKGDWLMATGTTLGADNGIAVAMMLAILDGALASHPTVECLFTTAEEVGLCGAMSFDYSRITARRMVNLDSEALGIITAGCAGGVRTDVTLPLSYVPFEGHALTVSVKGLMGGHSGESINTGRANANLLLGRILATALGGAFHLLSLEGGSKDNAIPRECVCRIAVADPEAAEATLSAVAASIASELVPEDRGFVLSIEEGDADAVMLDRASTDRALMMLSAMPNGVFEMNRNVAGLVEYSRNLGVVRTEEGRMTFVFAARSSMEARLDASCANLDAVARAIGAETHHHSRYPGWTYAPESPLRDAYREAFRRVTGREAVVNTIHAGLECGIISSKVPGMDIISIGPDMKDIHSPDEALSLPSVELFWQSLVELMGIL